MRVSHGCIRMYPEGIEKLYDLVKEGDKVEIVEQNVKAGWQGGVLFLEVHTMHSYGLEEDEPKKPNIRLLPEAAKIIQKGPKMVSWRLPEGLWGAGGAQKSPPQQPQKSPKLDNSNFKQQPQRAFSTTTVLRAERATLDPGSVHPAYNPVRN